MSTLLLDRTHLEVRTDGEALALYEGGERRGCVPIKLLDRCVIHGAQTRLDSGVLMKLAEAGVTTVILSPRIGRRVAIVLGAAHNDAAVRLAQAQRVMDRAWCRDWAQSVVTAKLRRQQRTLDAWLAARPDARKPLTDARRSVAGALASLADPAAPRPDTAALRGIEGAAARAHFAGLAAVLPSSLNFTGRNRRPPRDPANACLSLAYTLLHAEAVAVAHAAGLDPLRAEVDHWVWTLFRDRDLREDHFTLDKGACLLGKAGLALRDEGMGLIESEPGEDEAC